MALFCAAVYYNPSFFYSVARGWSEEDLLSGRMHTPDAIRGPLTLLFSSAPGHAESAPRGCEEGVNGASRDPDDDADADGGVGPHIASPQPCITLPLRRLKQEAMRSLLLAYAASVGRTEEGAAENNKDGSTQNGEKGKPVEENEADTFRQIESSIERWAELAHLRCGSGPYLVEREEESVGGSGGQDDTPMATAPDAWPASAVPPPPPTPNSLLVDDARRESGLPSRRDNPLAGQGNAPLRQRQAVPAPAVYLPSSHTNTVLVLSFLREAEWRALRREQRQQQLHQQQRKESDGSDVNQGDARSRTAEDTALLLGEDDCSFARWLSAKQAALQVWSRRYRHHAPPVEGTDDTHFSHPLSMPSTDRQEGHGTGGGECVNVSHAYPEGNATAAAVATTPFNSTRRAEGIAGGSPSISSSSSEDDDDEGDARVGGGGRGDTTPSPEEQERRQRILAAIEARRKK